MKWALSLALMCVLVAAGALGSDPAAVGAYRYAAGLYDMGEHELAIQEFSAFLGSFPEDSLAASAAFWLGESHFQMGQHHEAAEAFSRAIRPGADLELLEDARLRKAEALWETGDAAGAAVAYEALLRAHPRGRYRGQGSYWLGRSYLTLGRKEQAARVLRNAAAWGESKSQRAEAAYLAGDILRELERCEEAGEQYRAVLILTPHGAHASSSLEGLGRCALEREDWQEAAAVLRQLTESFPHAKEATQARFHLAECLSSLGTHIEALAAYRAVLRDPQAVEFWDRAVYGEAWAAAATGDTVAALASYAQLSLEFPGSPLAAEGKFREAQLAYAAGEVARAQRAFSELMSDWPGSPFIAQALYWRGWCQQKRDILAAAEHDFLNYASLYPDSLYAANSLLMAGLLAKDQGSSERARTALEKLRCAYPGSELLPQALTVLAEGYAAEGDEDKANAIRSQLAMEFPESREATSALLQTGFSNLEHGKETAALARFRAVIERPDVSEKQKASAMYYLAEAHYRLEDYAEAESLYVRAEKLNAGVDLEDDAIYGAAWSALRAGEINRAGAQFARLATAFPESPFAAEATFRQGQALYDQGNYQEAATAYGSLLKHYGGTEYADDALYAQAWSQLKQGNLSDASGLLRKMVELFPGSELVPDALYDLGTCYTRLNRVAGTARTLRQLLVDYPSYPRAREAAMALVEAYDVLGKSAARDSVLATLTKEPGGEEVAAKTLLNLAAKKMENGDAEATDLLQRLVTLHPTTPEAEEARLQLGWIFFQEGRVDEAYEIVRPLCESEDSEIAGRACMRAAEAKYEAQAMEEAAELYQQALHTGSSEVDRAAAWYGLAWCRMELGERPEAIEAFAALYQQHKESPLWNDGAYRLGQLLLEEGKSREAADVYAALGEHDDAGAKGLEASYKRALILRERKAYSQAASLLRKVSQKAEGRLAELALYQLARTLHLQNRLTDASKVFVSLADKYPESDVAQQAVYSAGICKLSMERWASSAELFARAASMPGELRADALLREGGARAKAGEHTRASKLFSQLLDEDPDYMSGAEVSFRLAQSLAEIGENAKVDSICGELVLRPDWAYPDRAWYLRAMAKKGRGDKEGAMAAYQEVLHRYPDSDLAPYARAQYDALAEEED